MCLLCVEIQKGQMTIREVTRAYTEIKIPREHEAELLKVIEEKYDFEELFKLLVEDKNV